jgi:hypothetical protein
LKNGDYNIKHNFNIEINLSSPPPKDEEPEPSSLVNDNDTTINLAQIERVNSLSMIKYNHNFEKIKFL